MRAKLADIQAKAQSTGATVKSEEAEAQQAEVARLPGDLKRFGDQLEEKEAEVRTKKKRLRHV